MTFSLEIALIKRVLSIGGTLLAPKYLPDLWTI